MYLVLEYLEGGELFDRIKKIGNFGEREACILFKKLMIGIDCKLFYKIYIILVLYIEILNQKTYFLKVKTFLIVKDFFELDLKFQFT